jgi:hypothetical protein
VEVEGAAGGWNGGSGRWWRWRAPPEVDLEGARWRADQRLRWRVPALREKGAGAEGEGTAQALREMRESSTRYFSNSTVGWIGTDRERQR